MSCDNVASILADGRATRLTAAEREQVDAHLLACESCAAAWHAESELLALRIPPLPTTLLERALQASRAPPSAPGRRARPFLIGSLMLAGAALAATLTLVVVMRSPSEPSAAVDGSDTATLHAAAPEERPGRFEQEPAESPDDPPTSVELVEMALSTAPMVRGAPDYPPHALEERLEGHVQLKFNVTAAGVVENVGVVESSDPEFEESAVRAVSSWRYLPRIAAGKRVDSKGIQTVIRFTRGANAPQQTDKAKAMLRQSAEFSTDLEVALDRLADDDLRGTELQLDEMQALYGSERPDLWNFYGYVYTLQGNYSRAIEAYETAVALAGRANLATGGPFVPLANLYFARHQYDLALKTLLRPNFPGGNRVVTAEAEALVKKLATLGVTEQTVR